MPRFRPHPAQMALALAVVASTGLTFSSCAAAPRSAEQTSTPSLALAVAPSSFDAAIRSLLAEPSEPLHAISAESLNALQAYYAENDYAPLWVGMDGLTPRGAQLVAALAKARDAGAPSLQPILIAVNERRTATSLMARAELEILLSGALLDTAVNTIDPTVSAPPTELLPAANATPDGIWFR